MDNLNDLINFVVPTVVADGLSSLCAETGLAVGPTPKSKFWFRSPQTHIFMTVVVLFFCAALHMRSRHFRTNALTTLGTRGAGWSTLCPINTLIAIVLCLCFCSQICVKSLRPQPFIQLGWLLMPCHLVTLAWIYVFARNKVRHYASDCFVASLLVDFWWLPVMGAAQPDWGDHQFKIEGIIFIVHHGLLVALPLYYAMRYHTLPLSREHVCYFTWTLTSLNYFVYTPYAMLTGLNLNYMLYPPPVSFAVSPLKGPYYKEFCVLVFIAMSLVSNVTVRGVAKLAEEIGKGLRKTKQKLS